MGDAAAEPSFPTIPALLCFSAARKYYHTTIISTREVFVSPQEGDALCPRGAYDIDVAVQAAREAKPGVLGERGPELLVVRLDGYLQASPRGLDRLGCAKVLVVGDLHHPQTPIRDVLAYASSERFDLILVEYNRPQVRFFREAGLTQTHWLPSLTLAPCERAADRTQATRVGFAGQAGAYHVYRRFVLEQIAKSGVAIEALYGTREQAADLYARCAVSLNISLNGDVNMRVLEVPAAGGLLLTDRLPEVSGQSLLLRDGAEMLTFASPEEAKHRIQWILAHPGEAEKIAQAGRAAYERWHRPGIKAGIVMRMLAGDLGACPWTSPEVLQATASRSVDLGSRIAIFELLQHRHRFATLCPILVSPRVDARIITEMLDLPRVAVGVACTDAGLSVKDARVKGVFQKGSVLPPPGGAWLFVICTRGDLADAHFMSAMQRVPVETIVVVDAMDDVAHREVLRVLSPRGLGMIARRPMVLVDARTTQTLPVQPVWGEQARQYVPTNAAPPAVADGGAYA